MLSIVLLIRATAFASVEGFSRKFSVAPEVRRQKDPRKKEKAPILQSTTRSPQFSRGKVLAGSLSDPDHTESTYSSGLESQERVIAWWRRYL